jgi:hypothetical protein
VASGRVRHRRGNVDCVRDEVLTYDTHVLLRHHPVVPRVPSIFDNQDGASIGEGQASALRTVWGQREGKGWQEIG